MKKWAIVVLIILFIGIMFGAKFLSENQTKYIASDNDTNTNDDVNIDTDTGISGDANIVEDTDISGDINITEDIDTSGDANVVKDTNIIHASSDTFETEVLKSNKIVLVDFYADWCGPCKDLAPILEEISTENTELKIVKVNTDEENELSYKYRVRYLPTLLFIKDGNEIERLVGLVDKETINSTFENIKSLDATTD